MGDDNQLAPLVKSEEALNLKMGVSLFERLQKAHPHSLASLTHQFRMNKTIMALCNSLIYNGVLRCVLQLY